MSFCGTICLLSICICYTEAVRLRSGSELSSSGTNSPPVFSFAVTECYTRWRPAALGSDHPILAKSGMCNACVVGKEGNFSKVSSSDVKVYYNGRDQGRMTTISESSAWSSTEILGMYGQIARYVAIWNSDEVVFMAGWGGSMDTCTVKAKILTGVASVAARSEPSLSEVEDSVAQTEEHSMSDLDEASQTVNASAASTLSRASMLEVTTHTESQQFDLSFITTACYTESRPGKTNPADHDGENGQILSDKGICNACKLGARGIIFVASPYGLVRMDYDGHRQGRMTMISPFTALGCTHATCKSFRYFATRLADEMIIMLGQDAGSTCTVKGKIVGWSGRHPAWPQ